MARGTLTYETPDATATVPDGSLIGSRLKHSGNGKVYVVFGFAWLGATDEWGFLHREEGTDGVVLCRPLEHMWGVRDNGDRRYTNA